jgi:hypothetical protein
MIYSLGRYNMKKILSILMVHILVLSGLGAVAINGDNTNNIYLETSTEIIKIDFPSLTLVESNNDYVKLRFVDDELYLMNPGQPMLPRVLKSIELPFGVRNIKVEVIPQGISESTISKEIMPTPAPVPQSPNVDFIAPPKKDITVYTSDALYPSSWYSYNVGCGLNADGEHVTHLTVNIYPVRYAPATGKICVAEKADVIITFDNPEGDIFPQTSEYDLVIIAPSSFSSDLQRLVDHKNSYGVKTLLKSTEEIYDEYTGVDKPEQIRYFIKDAIETWEIKYVLLVGGLKSTIYAKPKDHRNYGASGWHLPVRYSNFLWDGDPNYNFTSGEPGYLCDLYYADIYKYDNVTGFVFDDWDSNGNGIFAEWAGDDIRDELDLYPDVAVGRLACRNTREVKTVVDKIINYETTADPSWFKKILSVSGDGFLDQEDLNIQWDVNELPDGEYTIYAQSTNPDAISGPIDELHVMLDRTVETNLSFNHDDHLKPGYKDYPAPPIAEIVSVSEGDIIGNTDFTYTPRDSQAYCNDFYFWANISYVDSILTIRGKSYDPRPYGNLTNIKVWIDNDNDETIFTAYRNDTETYYEGEWGTGEKLLYGRGGGLYYMPDDFEKEIVWTSNGKWVDQSDVIEAFSKGYGFVYFSGHGSPGWWGNHYPGIPGNRGHAQVAGLVVSQVSPFFPYFTPPVFPMNQLSNTDKLPVVCVGGCHNSQFNVSFIPTLLHGILLDNHMNTYGRPIPECWSWYMVKLPKTGAIATIGNTGYGWGSEGDVCNIGPGDVWINTEFFRQYGEEDQQILGMAYSQAITGYITNHKSLILHYWRDDYGWDGIDEKTVQQWLLLGDPSLKMGGYS